MTAKAYLQQLYRLDLMINQNLQELDNLKATATSLSASNLSADKVSSSKGCNASFVNTVNRIIEMQDRINKQTDKFIAQKELVIEQIRTLPNVLHSELLYKRYAEFKRFEVIAVEMCYNFDYVRRVHGEALEDFKRSHKMSQKVTYHM